VWRRVAAQGGGHFVGDLPVSRWSEKDRVGMLSSKRTWSSNLPMSPQKIVSAGPAFLGLPDSRQAQSMPITLFMLPPDYARKKRTAVPSTKTGLAPGGRMKSRRE